MRIRATCHTCKRDFLFFQLYNADLADSDRCPHCQAHLGIPNVRGLMQAADNAALVLFSTLEQMKDRDPAFSIELEPWIPRLKAVASTPEPEGRAHPSSSFRHRFRRLIAA